MDENIHHKSVLKTFHTWKKKIILTNIQEFEVLSPKERENETFKVLKYPIRINYSSQIESEIVEIDSEKNYFLKRATLKIE